MTVVENLFIIVAMILQECRLYLCSPQEGLSVRMVNSCYVMFEKVNCHQ